MTNNDFLYQSVKKYNWWTPENEKQKVNLESRIEYILKFGNLFEILKILKNYPEKSKEIFEKVVIYDPTVDFKRKKIIYFFIYEKKLTNEDYKKFFEKVVGKR